MIIKNFVVIAAAGVIFLGLWWRGEFYARKSATDAALLRSAIAIGDANAALATAQAAAAQRIDAVARVAAVQKQQIRDRTDLQREEIRHAPLYADGPLAPVLRDQLNRLPEY